MLISIIIPTHNSEKYIKKTIFSALDQSYKNIEIIVVDDCSNDNTTKIVKLIASKEKKVFLYTLANKYNKKSSGSGSKPRNFGIKKSKGEYIAFLDSDDFWEKDKLRKQVSSFKKNKLISFTNCKYISKDKIFKEKFIKRKFIEYSLKKLPEGLLLYNPIRLSSVIVKKDIFKKINFCEEKEINAIEDLELWLNFFFKNKKNSFIHVDQYLTTIRRHKNNLSKNYASNVIKNIYSISRFIIRDNRYTNLRFFISGIFFRVIQLFLKKYKTNLINLSAKIIIFLILGFSLIFKSPFFWYIGNKLVYEDEISKSKSAIIFSGHGSLNYENKTYQNRYLDAKMLLEKGIVEKVYILGREQIIPESKIISALLMNDGFLRKKVIPLETYKRSTKDNILFAGNFIKDIGENKVIFVTDPYHSLRSYLLWKKYHPDLNVIFNTTVDRPNKDKIRWTSNKDQVEIVIYEYLAIVYNYLKGWI